MNWAGSKQRHFELVSELIKESGKRTITDPFMGSGQLVFKLIKHNFIDRAILSDSCSVLINLFSYAKKHHYRVSADDYEKNC